MRRVELSDTTGICLGVRFTRVCVRRSATPVAVRPWQLANKAQCRAKGRKGPVARIVLYDACLLASALGLFEIES